jgi:uncharacterized protein (DUF697 family)
MPGPLMLANVWRILRDVNLEAIRQAALSRFELAVVADSEGDAAALAALLSGGGGTHPWLRASGASPLVSPGSDRPIAVILVTRTLDLSPAMTSVRNAFRSAVVPTLTVVVGETGPIASAPRVGEDARVAVTALDDSAAVPVGSALLGLFSDDRRVALARALPPLRASLYQILTQETSQANAGFALTTGLAETVPVLSAPAVLGDIVILTKNQVLLGYRIVLGAGRDDAPRKLVAEVLAVLGGGLLFRQIARELVGIVPVAGLPLKVAVAYSGTWAIGRAMGIWVTEGRRLTSSAMRGLRLEGLDRGRAVARRLLAARGGKRLAETQSENESRAEELR